MTNKVTIKSTKEPVRLRVKNLANGVQSLYLDCFMWTESAAMSF